MAEEEVGKIEINSTIYPIKDETARQNIETVANITEGQYNKAQTKVTVGSATVRITSTTMTRLRTIAHPKGMVGKIKVHKYSSTGTSATKIEVRVGGIVWNTFNYATEDKEDETDVIYATEGTAVEIWGNRTGSVQISIATSAEYLQLNSNA